MKKEAIENEKRRRAGSTHGSPS
eukprot:SAG11_NODE_9255_length_928_cov_1.042220_1_plen_22_part_10